MRRTLLVLAVVLPRIARADPPTDRNYAIELYEGVAFGNSATTAMGGAAVANAIGSSGTLANASAPAVRPTTDTATWSWDYHLDSQTSSLSKDFENSGRVTGDEAGGSSQVTGGIAVRVGDWAGALTVSYEEAPLVGTLASVNGQDVALHATTTRSRLALARYFPSIDVAVGAALDLAQFALVPECTGQCADLFSITGGGGSAGATWLPSNEDFRIGVQASSPSRGGNVAVNNCDPMDCSGYVLPESVVSPWQIAAGVAYRVADTPWNHLVGGLWRDEKAITLAADVAVIGASPNAFGLTAFGMHDLQRAGRHVGVSPRGGVEYEWLPGRLRLRAGSYWEPARFDEVGGRLHATFGLELRVLQVNVFGLRRGRITLTGDIAPRYDNVGLSLGFWH